MDYDVLEARYLTGHVIWLRFRDGTEGEIDLAPELWGEVFEPLRDVEFFRRSQQETAMHHTLAGRCPPAPLSALR